MKSKNRIIIGASSVLVFIIVLFSTLFSQINNLGFYDKEYQKYNIYDRFSKDEAINATRNILGFFQSRNDLDDAFFKENEISHLQDVKNLLQKSKQLYYVSVSFFWLILVAYYLFYRKTFMKFFSDMLFYSGIFSLAFILLFSIFYALSGFDFIFELFHKSFFMDNWAFNPELSNMKALFPDAFFLDFSIRILIYVIIKLILLTGVGYMLRKKN